MSVYSYGSVLYSILVMTPLCMPSLNVLLFLMGNSIFSSLLVLTNFLCYLACSPDYESWSQQDYREHHVFAYFSDCASDVV